MSQFVIRHVALTFDDEARCKAFHKRIREMFIRHSSHNWTYGETEEITLNAVGGDEADWHNQLGYVFKGRNEEERLVRIWSMGQDSAKVKLSFKDMFEPDPKTLLIVGEEACWGSELFSCFRQYLDGDFGLKQVKVLLWCEDYSAEVWCQDSVGVCYYNGMDSDSFNCMREELAGKLGLDDACDVDDVEALEATGVLDDGSEYGSYCSDLDDINMDEYPVFYDEDAEVSADESESSSSDSTTSCEESEGEEDAETAGTGQRFCEQCGARLEPGCAFCTECGASIDNAPVRSDGERTFFLPRWMRNAKNGGQRK